MDKEKKHKVHNLVILDESGSMMSIKNFIIRGFNELVQTTKGIEKAFPEQEHFISLITFNGLGQNFLHFAEPVSRLEMIDDRKYKPDSFTPLFDAMGFSFAKLRDFLEHELDYHVLVTILTDGEENASKEFDGYAIRKLVEELKLNGWTFTYIGTDHNVEEFAISLSIQNSMTFEKNESGIERMFSNEKEARFGYCSRIRDNREVTDDYYADEKVEN